MTGPIRDPRPATHGAADPTPLDEHAEMPDIADIASGEPGSLIEHPDGYYWTDGKQAFGPFSTIELAAADRDRYDELESGEDEALRDAEEQLGIADWIDPETGEPAPASSPHIADQ